MTRAPCECVLGAHVNILFPNADLATLDADLLVVGASSADDLNVLGGFAGALTEHLAQQSFTYKAGTLEIVPTMGAISALAVAVVGTTDATTETLLEAARQAGSLARGRKATHVALHLGAIDSAALSELIVHLRAGNYRWDKHLPAARQHPALETLTFVGLPAGEGRVDAVSRALTMSKWQDVARDLVNMPPADLYPESLAEEASRLQSIPGVSVDVWDFEKCRAEGLVGIIAVGQGSTRPGTLSWLRYRPANAVDHIALVGKGVTFDAGGLSLKPSAAMQTMRCDMGGAATALAAFGAIAELGLPIAVDCLLPSVENMCAANSFKLGDILTYRNGVTVEIHNTDAEGRLILADALILASELDGVSTIVDMATLTGACIIALGDDFTAMYSHDDTLAQGLLDASDKAGELMWRMPLHKPYNRQLKGTWSEIKNVGGRPAGSITAALFLSHFVRDDVTWAHLDIAGTAFADKASNHYAAGGTGQVVRALAMWAAEHAESKA